MTKNREKVKELLKKESYDAIVELGEEVIEDLIFLIDDEDTLVNLGAPVAIAGFDEKGAAALLEVAKTGTPDEKISAMSGLGQIGSDSSEYKMPSLDKAVDLFIDYLEDENKHIRTAAAHSLRQMAWRRAMPNAVKPLLKALEDEYPSVGKWAAEALAKLSNHMDVSEAVEPLLKLLNGESNVEKDSLVDALVDIADSKKIQEILPQIIKLLESDNVFDLMTGCRVIADISKEIDVSTAIKPLTALKKYEDEDEKWQERIRKCAKETLEEIQT